MSGRTPLLLCLSILPVACATPSDDRLAFNAAASCIGVEDAAMRLTCFDNAFAPEASEAQVASTPTAPAPPPAAEPELGAEQVAARRPRSRTEDRARELIQSTIVDMAQTNTGEWVFVLANGQVWKQRRGDRQSLKLSEDDRPEAVIRRGAISGYRLELPQHGKTLIVERLQ